MAGETNAAGGAVALKQFQPSDLLSQILGTNQSTNTTTNTVGTANTAPLQQVFGAAMQPMNQQLYDNLIASIFQKAAEQTPGLTQALANATGSRTGGNSPLALALNEQNNNAARDSAGAILSQQNKQLDTANTAAGNIAQATRGTNQTQGQTQKSGLGVDPMVALLGGQLMNYADKKNLFDKAGDAITSGFDSMFSGTSSPIPFTGSNFGGINTNTLGGIDFASSGGNDFFSNFDTSNFLSAAPSFAGDVFSGAGDLFSSASSGISSLFSNIGSFFGFADGGQVSAAGGKGILGSRTNVIDGAESAAINGQDPNIAIREILKSALTPQARVPQALDPNLLNFMQYLLNVGPGIRREDYAPQTNTRNRSMEFADGGVIRNRNNMGDPLTRYGMNALEFGDVGSSGSGTTSNMLMTYLDNIANSEQSRPSERVATENNYHDSAAGYLNNKLGNPQGQKVAEALMNVFNPAASLVNVAKYGLKDGLTAPSGVGGLLRTMLSQGYGGYKANEAIADSSDPLGAFIAAREISAPDGIDVSGLPQSVLQQAINAVTAVQPGLPGLGTAIDPETGKPTSSSNYSSRYDSITDNISADDPDPLGSLISQITGLGQSTWSSSDSTTSGDSSTSSDSSDSGDSGGYSFSPSYADGGLSSVAGRIKGRGTGTSDSIHAKSTTPGSPDIALSDGEGIIPKDVIDAVGWDHFQSLIDAFHTPVRR